MVNLLLIIPGVAGFICAAILTYLLIPLLKRLAGQNIREEGPEAHKAKAGTPSMGGIAIIIGTLVAFLVGRVYGSDGWVVIGAMVLFGAIGFFDDYLKVIKHQNEGLKAWQKFGLQFIFSLALAFYFKATQGTEVGLPFAKTTVDFGIMYIPFIVFTLLAMVNAVNLTDGLDGLAAGTTTIVAGYLTWMLMEVSSVAFMLPTTNVMIGLVGACLGFLVFNKNPAKIFMGDTGSLALGGVITAAAITAKMELILPIIGLVYVMEVLSVCIQVAYFKATHGKRIFKMTPIHHHFELCGMKEKSVVFMFWGITFVCCLIGVFIV